jgi:hypothetical protein
MLISFVTLILSEYHPKQDASQAKPEVSVQGDNKRKR